MKTQRREAEPVAPDNSGQRSALTSVSDLNRSADEIMRSLLYILALAVLASAPAAEMVLNGGVAYVAFTGMKYESNPDPTIVREDRSTLSPFLGVCAEFSEAVSLRLGYQYLGTLVTEAVYPVPPGPGDVKPQVVVPAHYRSSLHLANLGLRFRAKVNPSISVFASPEANWVIERGEVAYFASSPIGRNGHRLTPGAAVGAIFKLDTRWEIEVSYRYADAGAVWARDAHSFGLGVNFR